MTRVPVALTIAGSDSGGGAGIQADIKSFSAMGAYGCSVITALTAQNTLGVQGVVTVEPDFVRRQMDSVFADIAVDAVKIGMLGTRAVIEAVADGLDAWAPRIVVLDPVMIAKGGHKLLADDAIQAVRELLLPRATLVTPNLPEAAVLADRPQPEDRAGMEETGQRIQAMGGRAVLMKGGHLDAGDAPDLLLEGGLATWFEGARQPTPNTHGTGCSFSSAIAALLAQGRTLATAVGEAKEWLAGAIAAGAELRVGHGHGPVHHFHALWRKG